MTTLFTISTCYILKRGVDVVFPVQIQLQERTNTFLRVDSNKNTIILNCPVGFYFSSDELKCKRSEEITSSNYTENSIRACPLNVEGPLSYPMNCRKYVNCSSGKGILQDCAEHLLFNRKLVYCDWPEETDCCEYKETR